MHIAVKSLFAFSLLSSSAWAVEPATPTAAPTAVAPATPAKTTTTPNPTATAAKPLTAEQIVKAKQQQDAKIKAMIQDQASRLKQLEHANLEALAQNQELQLKNDNLTVQVQVLQSERSAQMFLYGAMTIAVGVILGFFIASYVYTKRRRQW
ncbi:hypothetical protein [Acinetobacter sp.]|uniref:hypothetical protein n=1 Tax=Acinetobacter sp. TaxID=472 RepID=UPI0031CF74FA